MSRYSPEDKEIFEKVRVHYRGMGGVVRGFGEEWDNFIKHHKKTWKTDLSDLMPGLLLEESYRRYQKNKGKFVPPMKYFSTWINGRWWTVEYKVGEPNKNENKCFCGAKATHSVSNQWFCSKEHRFERMGW